MCLACSPARGSGSCGSRGGANLEARVRGLVRPREEELELAYRALDDERASGLARRAVEVVERRDAERERAVGLLARLSCFVPGALTSLHGRLLDADVPSSFSYSDPLQIGIIFRSADPKSPDRLGAFGRRSPKTNVSVTMPSTHSPGSMTTTFRASSCASTTTARDGRPSGSRQPGIPYGPAGRSSATGSVPLPTRCLPSPAEPVSTDSARGPHILIRVKTRSRQRPATRFSHGAKG